MRTLCIVVAAAAVLAACSQTRYWSRDNASLQQVATDLADCRMKANQGGEKVFSAIELESPCMVSKGYALSTVPPKRTE